MIDRLMNRIEVLKCPICVGLDPTPELIPENMRKDAEKDFKEPPMAAAFAMMKFSFEIIDAIAGIVPAVKPNISFFERYGVQGFRAYDMTCEYAWNHGLMVIGDIKRGDIGSTAKAYAGHLESQTLCGQEFEIWKEDAVTLNPYLGTDSITPFLDVLRVQDKGVFVLVKTSNPGSADIQDLIVVSSESGTEVGTGTGTGGGFGFGTTVPLYEHVAGLVKKWGAGEGLMGAHGYSKVGAVVGATHPETGARLRELMPSTFFLVPGYGAQGATAKDVRRFFDIQGKGVIVNSSRGIIGAWKTDRENAGRVGRAARDAALRMRDEIGAVL